MISTWIFFLVGAFLASAAAQDSLEQTEEIQPKRPGIPLRVIESREIDLGNRSLIFNRVEPPNLPKHPPAPPAPKEPNYSPETLEMIQRREKKVFGMLFVSATVYDRQVTDLRWSVSGHPEIHAYANIDFNLMAGTMEIETEDAIYMILMGLGNETRLSLQELNRYLQKDGWPDELRTKIPLLREFPAGKSTYREVPDDRQAVSRAWRRFAREQGWPEEDSELPVSKPADSNFETAEGIDPNEAMDALLTYYDTNYAKLAREYEIREKTNRAREKWLKEHPPVPKDTVINFWPQRNSVYLDAND